MEEEKKVKSLKRKRMTGQSFRKWVIQQAQRRKCSENANKKEDHVSEEEHHVTESNRLNEEETIKYAHRVDDQREKHACPSEKNDKKDIEPFRSELRVDRTANCKGSKQDDKIEGESKDCLICKQEGNLLSCAGQGCKRSFHLSCVDPPLSYFPPGPWHCYWCVRRKLKLGVHSVSEGVDSLLDVRECNLGNEVMQKREYLVKYKGLAHVHNRWITEKQLLLEAPAALRRFKKKNKSVSWKTEWSLPHRLLDKRLIAVTDHNNTHVHGIDENDADCHYEWLVKWTGLGYSHATWEVENASFLRSLEAVKLMTNYEIRHQQATKELHPLTEDEKRKADYQELPRPLFGSAPQVHNHLTYINTLRKYWQKGQSAVVIDDQERILKVVLFLLSLPKDIGLPFLIITTSAELPLWEAEFLHWAFSANIVVYKGNKDIRAIIRTLEFHNKQGAIMFQVLLSPYDAIVEDLEMLQPISWGAVIIDQCQGSAMSMLLSQIKVLVSDMRLLIFRQLEGRCDRGFNHSNVLSLLYPEYDKADNDLSYTDPNIDLTEFKERLKRFVAYECNSSTSKFIEYWVPVKLSNEQIEQYCNCLSSNSALLCSRWKNDSPNSLHNILVSTRKCCDHPYLEDRSLRDIVLEGIPVDQHFDAEIKLSGKLEFLYKILREIKQQGQRVLILFRSLGGSGVISIGDILDDFIHRKFGEDSYTRISGEFSRKLKQATLNKFNNEGSGKFACLMETRVCAPSVKLSRIDTIILFNSDWDPTNDLRSLQKIAIYSKLEQIKVLRLYSYFTVEEKALILAKQGMTIDSNIENIKQFHELLTWGASFLFKMLDCFHVQSSQSKRSSDIAALDDVFAELLGLISSNSENSDYNSCSKILKVQQNGGTYPRNISLLGEVEMQLMDDSSFVRGMTNEFPNVFWTSLLHGTVRRWKHLPRLSQGIRRKVRPRVDLCQPSEREQVSEKKGRKEGNKVHLTPEPKLRTKRKLHVQGKRLKLGMSHLSAGNKYKCRRLVTNPSLQCDIDRQGRAAIDKVQSRVGLTMTDQHRKESISMKSNQLPDSNLPASTGRDQAHAFVPIDNHQSHRNCIDSSSHQVLDFMDLQPEELNFPIDSSIQWSTGNLLLQQHTSTGAGNDASMRSRNSQEYQCRPDASPDASELLQSPCPYPLQMEMERILKEREQTTKLHENLNLLLISEYEKELDAIKKKYDLLFEIADTELVQKHKDLDTLYNKVHMNKLLAEAMTQIQNTAWSLEMTEGTGQSSPSRPSRVPAVTAASTQPASQSSNILNYPSLVSEPVNSEQRAADHQISSQNFSMAVIPSQNAELPIVTESAAVPPTSARVTLQTTTSANLPISGSPMTPTRNLQPVILTPFLSTSVPSQLSIQTFSYAASPATSCVLRAPAPHLRHFRPLPTMNSWNSSLLQW
ncbi:uncharacterized protein LOC107792831 isoform X1 [Nicotiana tabacum]|uniref:Chromodomain-helicase-DNA-binding protein Mi-2 homolog isoform X1 n=2 Tax=Nicotiana tabacum TaxID=4097 RepID=A0A1S4A1T1_TOBAC|nr:PREDICTED: chromodomain-helicase-DNA-binding protein Mi-2 homolog isoform X1 [Nicotiana tabacum]